MEAANQTVVDNLQTACQLMAHLAGQYQIDVRSLKAYGLKSLSKCIRNGYGDAEEYLRQFIDRLLYFGELPTYNAGIVAALAEPEDILKRAKGLVYDGLDKFHGFRKQAWEAEADYTCDIYEHAVHMLEKQAIKIDRELKNLGVEGYLGASLANS